MTTASPVHDIDTRHVAVVHEKTPVDSYR